LVENPIDPRWNQSLELSQQMSDPLGLSRVSEWIVGEILPGITTLTTRARNYSFYCWALQDIIEKNKGKKFVNLGEEITRRETAFVISSILHDCRKDVSPIGVRKAKRILDESDEDTVNVNFSVLQNRYGAFGQYYRSAMENLGLIINTSKFSIPTKVGMELGKSYRNWIENTEYYRNYRERNNIPKKVLEGYGEKAAVCEIKSNKKERELLLKTFLGENPEDKGAKYSRRDTIILVLRGIESCYKYNIKFDDEIFRNIIYFNQITDEEPHEISIDGLEDALSRWRLFQFHEYLTLSLETLFHSFLKEMISLENGMSLEEFYKNIEGYEEEIEKLFYIKTSEKSIKGILDDILHQIGLDSLSKDESKKFDEGVNLKSDVNEYRIQKIIEEKVKKGGHSKELVGLSLALVLINFLRFYHYKDRLDDVYLWYHGRASEEWSHPYFLEIENILQCKNLKELTEKIFNLIIERHDEIAWEKMVYGNDTFRFSPKAGGRYHYEHEKELYTPKKRSTRVDSLLSILEDLDVIQSTESERRLTEIGEKILGGNFHE